MKKFLVLTILVFTLLPYAVLAQTGESTGDVGTTPGEAFYRGEVVEVLREEIQDAGEGQYLDQLVKIKITSGDKNGQELEVENNGIVSSGGQAVKAGDKIVVYMVYVEGQGNVYYIADHYRLPSMIFILVFFFAVAILFARWKGVTSILGLAVTILVIAKFVVPQIIAGKNPVLVSLAAALIIGLVSIYLSHGFNKRTTVALIGTFVTLGLAAGMATVFVSISKLFGVGSEQAFYLQFGSLENLNLQGLLLGGIILGALGVLDDVTTTQAASVDEIKKANPNLSFIELYKSGLSVGREHIASLVNTLFLAYTGASLPLFIFFTTTNPQPLWTTLNAEFIAEEVVRTLVGSIALILAVPITTFLAAYFFTKTSSSVSAAPHHHVH